MSTTKVHIESAVFAEICSAIKQRNCYILCTHTVGVCGYYKKLLYSVVKILHKLLAAGGRRLIENDPFRHHEQQKQF